MLSSVASFLVLINPFALFVYLVPLMDELTLKDFLWVLFKATIISFTILIVFALTGDSLFTHVLQIRLVSFKIFGGIVIFAVALVFIIQGKKSLITLRGSLDDLAAEIALPFMIGAGTISLAIFIGLEHSNLEAVTVITLAMISSFVTMLLLTLAKYKLITKRFRTAFDKVMGTFLRVNGFFVGAIGIDMTLDGLRKFIEP